MKLSRNAATGCSTNFECPLGCPYCYCERRTKASIKTREQSWDPFFRGKIGPNTGPITWPVQQHRYHENLTELLLARRAGRMTELAVDLARQVKTPVLRQLGSGSLNRAMIDLICEMSLLGVKQYLYDRQPTMIAWLANHLDWYGIEGNDRPYVLGSFDGATQGWVVDDLERSTKEVNGEPALAYVSFGEIPDREHVKVILGYHDNGRKTHVDDPRACPKTNGENVTCLECQRCWGHHGRGA